MKNKLILILEKRAQFFDSIQHSYEARKVRSAIDIIERLLPPESFE